MINVPEAVLNLSPPEKLALIEVLWNSIASNPDDVPLMDWQKERLDQAIAAHAANPGAVYTWEEVQERARASYARRIIDGVSQLNSPLTLPD